MKTLLTIILFVLTSSAQAYQLTAPGTADWIKWGDLTSGVTTLGTTGGVVSYSFADSAYTCEEGGACSSLNDYSIFSGYQSVIASAFDTWSNVADITFELVTASPGNIVFGAENIDGARGVLAHALTRYFPSQQQITHSGIHFDLSENWSITDILEITEVDFFTVALHEIGHALGLGHSDDSFALMFPSYSLGAVKGLGTDDIAGITALYGASVSAVPEPSTYLLFLLGLVLVARFSRKQSLVSSL